MKRIIVDYSKLTNEILNLLIEKFPDGYDDSNIISFRNAKNELIEAVEVRTEDTIYLVKVSTKLASRLERLDDDDDLDDIVEPIDVKAISLDDDDIPTDDDEDDKKKKKKKKSKEKKDGDEDEDNEDDDDDDNDDEDLDESDYDDDDEEDED